MAGTEAAGEVGDSIVVCDDANGDVLSVSGDTSGVDPSCTGKGVAIFATFPGSTECFSSTDTPAIFHELSLEGVSDTTDWLCRVETCDGASFDTGLRLFEGDSCSGAFPNPGCQDDGCGLQSTFEFDPNDYGGSKFLVQVTGFGSGEGPYTLSVTCGTTLTASTAALAHTPAQIVTAMAQKEDEYEAILKAKADKAAASTPSP